MSRKRFYQVSILVLTLITGSLFVGFSIARQWGINQAVQACDRGYGLEPLETPVAVQAKLTTYGRTISPRQNRDLWWPPDAGRLVWLVEMEGNWLLVGGPAPDPSNPVYVHECVIVIDALTGESKTDPIE